MPSRKQPDDKLTLGGLFTANPGFPRVSAAWVNADGTLDLGFDPRANQIVRSVAVQPDGKLLLGGAFGGLRPNGAPALIPRSRIARLNEDGTLDPGFVPSANDELFSVALQADGRVLLAGNFTEIQGHGAATPTVRNFVARLNADGTLDATFDPRPNGQVWTMAVQPDGKVLLGGLFTTLQPNGAASPTARQNIARVNADGTLDAAFDPRANARVWCVAVQADDRVLLGGDFTTLHPNGAGSAVARNHIARVNADGTLDPGFDPNTDGTRVISVAVQTDGRVLLGGNFFNLQPNGAATPTPRRRIARVNADGTLDAGFDPSASGTQLGVAVQADGRILLGGDFTALQPNGAPTPVARNCFARLLNDPATQVLTAPTATQALWTRTGAGPELTRATFEVTTDGGATWSAPIQGARIGTTAHWQTTGPTLPVRGQLRARGATSGGQYNATNGLVEQIAPFDRDADADGLLDTWELLYFPTLATIHALDDSDGDGVVALLELAFAMHPLFPDAFNLPQATNEAGYLTITINKRPGAAYEVQSAGTLLDSQPTSFSPASTTILFDTATALKACDNVLLGTPPARFLQVKVTAAPKSEQAGAARLRRRWRSDDRLLRRVRENLPSAPIDASTLASTVISGADETAWHTFIVPASAQVTGAKVLAAEVHHAAANSGDLGFDLRPSGSSRRSTSRARVAGVPTSLHRRGAGTLLPA